MLSDLSITTMFGALVIAVIGGLMVWMGKSYETGTVPLGGKLVFNTAPMKTSPQAQDAGLRAAGPFMERYGMILLVCAALVILLSFISGIAAVLVHIIALVFVVLGVLVCTRKASAAASQV